MTPDAIAELVCETPVARRAELLELAPDPAAVVPLLPEAELCFTAKAIGLADAGWLLEHATTDQLRIALDLDAWHGLTPSREGVHEWLGALKDSEGALLRACRELDLELLVLIVRDLAEVFLRPDDEWQPPDGAMTIEGQFFLVPKRDADDLETLMQMLQVIFQQDYWLYFRLLQGAIWEMDADCEEFALRWRTARLADLGFPAWDEAMRVYARVPRERMPELPEEPHALEPDASLPVEMPSLPLELDSRFSLFRAAAELSTTERQVFFQRFVALANAVAVADRMPLGDVESAPRAIEKAARTASLGLDHVAAERGLSPPEVLRRADLRRLHQVGASLDPSVRPPLASDS